ncbi:MAG: type VI secretion system tip protein VgrG [Fibrobacterota bacterium]|nr:MAG: type VI secretion system tip protein VgrG [Fibrobacterota bacterium]
MTGIPENPEQAQQAAQAAQAAGQNAAARAQQAGQAAQAAQAAGQNAAAGAQQAAQAAQAAGQNAAARAQQAGQAAQAAQAAGQNAAAGAQQAAQAAQAAGQNAAARAQQAGQAAQAAQAAGQNAAAGAQQAGQAAQAAAQNPAQAVGGLTGGVKPGQGAASLAPKGASGAVSSSSGASSLGSRGTSGAASSSSGASSVSRSSPASSGGSSASSSGSSSGGSGGSGRADTTLYTFEVTGLSESFGVLRFSAIESISAATQISILAISTANGLAHDDMVGKEAVLRIHVNGEHCLRGVVTEFHEEPFGDKYSRYEISMRGRVDLLSYSAHNRVFQNKTIPEILKEVAKDAGLEGKLYKENFSGSYQPRELHVQYNESDLSFFHRTAHGAGIFFYEETVGEDVTFVVADDNNAFQPSEQTDEMQYRPGAGLVEENFDAIFSLRRSNALHKGGVRLTGYDYQKPGAIQKGQATGQGQGEWVRHEVDTEKPGELTKIAKFARESEMAARDRVTCSTHNPMMRAGTKFTISQQFGRGFGGDYVLIEVKHEGSQEGSLLGNGQDSHYSNTVVAQSMSLAYRPSPLATRPQVPGVLVVKSDGPDGDYAHIDDAGRYRAKFPFDEAPHKDGQMSPPVRLSQPYAGPGYGMHMPIHKGADLVLAFEDGDVDKPIAIGTLPNPSNKSPVTANNKSQSVFKTATGNTLTLDDLKDKTRVQLNSSGGRKLALEDNKDIAGALLETVNKHRLHLDDKGDTLELSVSDNTHGLTIQSKKGIATLRTKSGHFLTLDDDKKALSIQTAGGHLVKMDDDGKMITIQDGNKKNIIQLDMGGNKLILKTEGDLEITAKGSMKVKAKDISMQADSGAINMKAAAGDIKQEAMNINLKATQKIAAEATMDAGIKGLNVKMEGTVNVESKAGVQNKMTGVMTNVEASAMNTVKGAIVMIN